MQQLLPRKFLTALQGLPVYAGDFLYVIKDKRFIVVEDVNIIANMVFFVTRHRENIYVDECVVNNDSSIYTNVHIDNFIDAITDEKDTNSAYAKFFFLLHRLPAHMKKAFLPFTKSYKLYCDYQGRSYEVTGCSRMGDITLEGRCKVMINNVSNLRGEL